MRGFYRNIKHLLCAIFVFCTVAFSSNFANAEYICDSKIIYDSCESGYYMTYSGSYNGTAKVGNACTACPSGWTCSGGTSAPTRTITLNKNGGSGTINGTSGTTSATKTCTYGSLCSFGSASGLTQTGYKFTGGWGTSSSCTATTTSFTNPSSSTYYACKTAQPVYTITLDSKYYATSSTTTGTAVTTNAAPTPIYVKYNTDWYTNINKTTYFVNLSTLPVYTGYTFGGFYTGKAGTGNQIIDASGKIVKGYTTAFTKNTTLYAKWTPNTVKVTLNNQSATTAGTTVYYYPYNTYNGSCYYFSNSSLTTCLAGATGGTKITVPTKTGYTFGGYYTGANGTGTQYVNASGATVNNIYKAVSSDITLYARWDVDENAIPTDVIFYCDKDMSSVAKTADGSDASFAGPDYSCSDLVNGTYICNGKYVTNWASVSYEDSHIDNAALCEYVKYAINEYGDWAYIELYPELYGDAVTYTITYNLNGGTNNSSNPTTYNVDTSTITLKNPTKTGYTFGGWYTNSGFTGTAVTSIPKGSTGNRTLYAKWTQIKYSCDPGDYWNGTQCVECTDSEYYCPGVTDAVYGMAKGREACPSATNIYGAGSASLLSDSQNVTNHDGVKDSITDCATNYMFMEDWYASAIGGVDAAYDPDSDLNKRGLVSVGCHYNPTTKQYDTNCVGGAAFCAGGYYSPKYANATSMNDYMNITYSADSVSALVSQICVSVGENYWSPSARDIFSASANSSAVMLASVKRTACPANSGTNGSTTAEYCTCNDGYNYNDGTTTTTNACVANVYKITLDSKYYASSSATSGTNVSSWSIPDTIYEHYNNGWYEDSSLSMDLTSLTELPIYETYVFAGFFTGKAGTGTQVIASDGRIIAPNFLFDKDTTIFAHYIGCSCDSSDESVSSCTILGTSGLNDNYCYYSVTCADGYSDNNGNRTFTTSGDAVTGVPNYTPTCKKIGLTTGYNCPADSTRYTSCHEGKYMATMDASGNYVYNGTPTSGNSCQNCPADAAYCQGGTDAPLYPAYLIDEAKGQYAKIFGNVNAEYYTCEEGDDGYDCTSLERLPEEMIIYDSHPGYTFAGFKDVDVNDELYIDANGNFLKGPSANIGLHAQWTQCPAGTYEQDGVCVTCPKGSYCANGIKNSCSEGTYADKEGMSECTACPSNSNSEAGASYCTCNNAEYMMIDGVCVASEFTITTTDMAAESTFSFEISASGTFYVDFDDGRGVQKIDRTNDTTNTTYTSAAYANAGTHTIKMYGDATGYSTSDSTAAISFENNTNIKSVDGSLGSIFGGSAEWMFAGTFRGCTSLQFIPDTLFSDVRGSASYMFAEAFRGCTSLQSIPDNLFSGVSGSAEGMFAGTFAYCTSLQSIPDNLFSGVSGSASYMFVNTFRGCTSLRSIPETLFSGVTGSADHMFSLTFSDCTSLTSLPNGLFKNIEGKPLSGMFDSTFNNCSKLTGYIPANTFEKMDSTDFDSATMSGIFTNTALDTQCPAGMYQYITGFESAWDGKVSCVPCPKGSYCVNGIKNICSEGSYQDTTGQSSCKKCPTANMDGISYKVLPLNYGNTDIDNTGSMYDSVTDCIAAYMYADEIVANAMGLNMYFQNYYHTHAGYVNCSYNETTGQYTDSCIGHPLTCPAGYRHGNGVITDYNDLDQITLRNLSLDEYMTSDCVPVDEGYFSPALASDNSVSALETLNQVKCGENSSTNGANCTCNDGYNHNGGTTTTTDACVANVYGAELAYECGVFKEGEAPERDECYSNEECYLPTSDACGVYDGHTLTGWKIYLNSGEKVVVPAGENVQSYINADEDTATWLVVAQWEPECYEIKLGYSMGDYTKNYAYYYMKYDSPETLYSSPTCEEGTETELSQDYLGYIDHAEFYSFMYEDNPHCVHFDGEKWTLTGDCSVTGNAEWSALYNCFNGYRANDDLVTYGEVCAANQYTVTFNANGGTGSMANQTFTYGEPQNLTANAFTRTGYTFNGWNTAENGGGTAYADKESVKNLTTENGATVTLYAQWEQSLYSCDPGYYWNGTQCVECTDFAYYCPGVTDAVYGTEKGKVDCPAITNQYGSIRYFQGHWLEQTVPELNDSVDTCAAAYMYSSKRLPGATDDDIAADWDPNSEANKKGFAYVTCFLDPETQLYTKNCTGYANMCNAGYYSTHLFPEDDLDNFQVEDIAFSTDTLDDFVDQFCMPVGSGYYSPSAGFSSDAQTVANSLKRYQCPVSTDGRLVESPEGADGASDCYVTCPTSIDIDNGTTTVIDETPNYPSYTCKYNAECDTGYHVNNQGTAAPSCSINTYTVDMYGNGGYIDGYISYVTQERTYNDGVKLTANTFTRGGYTFAGWNTSADGSGTSYADGTTENLTDENGATITLYAQWSQCPAGTYSANGTCVTCPKGSYCANGIKNKCSSGTYADKEGMTECTACPVATNQYGSAYFGVDSYKLTEEYDIRDSIDTCAAMYYYMPEYMVEFFIDMTVQEAIDGFGYDPNTDANKRGIQMVACSYNAATGTYTTNCEGFAQLCSGGGYYSPKMPANVDFENFDGEELIFQTDTLDEFLVQACVPVGVGYWSPDGKGIDFENSDEQEMLAVMQRHACPTGLTTIGYGAGADEAGDCGRVLHVYGKKLYLRSTEKTDVSLHVKVDGVTFFGNMVVGDRKISADADKTLKIKHNGQIYSVYDDSVN